MPKRIAVNKIILQRDGKRVTIKPKQSFDFTAAELKDINENAPDSLRKIINEEDDIVEVKVPTGDTDKSADATPATQVKGEVGTGSNKTTGNKTLATAKTGSASEEL